MAKLPINPFLLLSKRWYKVATEGTSSTTARVVQPAVSTMRRMAATESGSSGAATKADGQKKEVFWMKHPKTGNWIPEDHFEDVDVAELREKLLNKH